MPSARIFSTILGIVLAVLAPAPVDIGWAVRQRQHLHDRRHRRGRDRRRRRPGAPAGIREARQKAVRLLVERMVPAEDRAKVPPVSDQRLDSMVRASSSRANAPPATAISARSAWCSAPSRSSNGWRGGISIAETVARGALVVPLWKDKGACSSSTSAIRGAMHGPGSTRSAPPCRRVVRGDQLDQDAMTVEQAMSATSPRSRGSTSAIARQR
jgi:hypothetical protein